MEQTTPPITREAALRVALAARAMPNASLPALIELLQQLKQSRSVTILHITHSQSEADRLADRVLQLQDCHKVH